MFIQNRVVTRLAEKKWELEPFVYDSSRGQPLCAVVMMATFTLMTNSMAATFIKCQDQERCSFTLTLHIIR